MGNSGFFSDGTDSVLYADNVNFSGSTRTGEITKDGQILIGSSTEPHIKAGFIKGTNGIVVNNNSGEIQLSFDPKFADPSVSSAVFASGTTSRIQTITSIFNTSNINSITSGDEILRVRIAPAFADSAIMIRAYVLASRREGNIGLSLIQKGKQAPLAFSVGYSAGYPNLCELFFILKTGSTATTEFSIRAGGVGSGPIVINGLPNGKPLLNDDLTSYLIVQEAFDSNTASPTP